jgi:aspartyl-tRNA(Asn)/glutamyl-tRNA(Gln) amidotransferase subunit A
LSEELTTLSLAEARRAIERGETTAKEVYRAFTSRAERLEPLIGAYLHLLDAYVPPDGGAEESGILRGLPISVKDNICIRGLPTTCGSRILENFVAPYDASVIARLKAAGGTFLGKTNCDEFAMGSSTESSAFGPTRNPWNLQCVPGGSSGGSAAAVAAGTALAALGSDTGGSIRQPAALCGVVGLKPTYGRVSRFGLVAFASSLDQIGPITRTVEDAALLMNVIAGPDPLDSTSASEAPPDFAGLLGRPVAGLRMGVPEELFGPGLHPEVRRATEAAIAKLEGLGAERVPVHLPHNEFSIACYYILATAEASANLARFDGVRYGRRAAATGLRELYERSRSEGFGAEVQRRILLGTYVLSSGYYDAYYRKAQKVRTLVRRDFDEAFLRTDFIVTPATPDPAFALGSRTDDPLKMYLSDVFTVSVNLAGIPGLIVPCGFTETGLPVGLQLLGRHLDEARLLQIGHAFEQATDFHRRRPALPSG